MFDRLLRGTGFAYRYTNADTVRVFRSGGALGDASIGQEIIVTGTRIGRNGEKTTAPVVALDKQDLEDAGAQDLSEPLAELTFVSLSNSATSEGGNARSKESRVGKGSVHPCKHGWMPFV